MRFDYDSMVLWYGTADAPAPSGTVSPSPATVTVAVQPPSVSNTVQVLYRVNGGAATTVNASMQRQDPVQKAQYYSATLPAFHPGDQVSYVAVARSPGRQVPSAADAATFPSMFTVGTPAASSSAGVASSTSQARSAAAPSAASGASIASSPAVPAATGATAGKGPYKVSGYVFYEYGLPATGVVTRLYMRGFGGTSNTLGEITTDVNGYYAIAYDTKSTQVNLEVRVVDKSGREVQLCDTKHGAARAESLNLVAPNTLRPIEAEFTRISADLGKEIGGLEKLSACREDEEQKDLTILADSTQWDARLVGLAASAVQIATKSKLPPDVTYALLRAGLPANANHLARVQLDLVEGALSAAVEADIVRMTAQQQAAAKAAFQKFALAELRATSTPGGVSSYEELLAHSGLSAAQQASFVELYFAHGDDPAGLWEKAAALGISREKIELLKLQGCLFQLTLNNAKLTEVLQHEIGTLANLSKLIDADLHQPDGWKTRLQKIANNNDKELAALIPNSYGAENTNERLEAYAGDLARRVRMSYPTHVTAHMLETGAFSIPGQSAGDAAAVAKLIKRSADLGYRMGETPVESFFRQHAKELTEGIKKTDVEMAKQHLKHLHRLHQITPSDEALKSLLETGVKSAYEVSALPFDAFMARYEHKFPDGEAELVYRKAQQVHSATFGISGIAQKAGNSSGGFALSAPPAARQASQSKLVEQFPSMGSLFGSLDFCECEDCRSVLGPAAYFVDILQFIDRGKAEWQQFLETWKSNHFSASYPYRDRTQMQEHEKPSHDRKRKKGTSNPHATPYEILIERRPDLPNLPLTCENTNTVMPYIDIVNEILEYFVAHETLTATSGHDSGKARTEELLAEPQNILPLAYEKLRTAQYPLSLPFDLWHESVRHLLDHVDAGFTEILEVFRPSEDLFTSSKSAKHYGYADVFLESLGLSQAEYQLLTGPSLAGHWFKLYGYDSESDALKELSSAKTLARSLDLSYLDLAAVLETAFVNPALNTMSLFWSLDVEVDELIASEASAAISPQDATAFEERLVRKAARFNTTSAEIHAWLAEARHRGDIGRIWRLAPPEDGSSDFGNTFVRTISGIAADAGLLLRINVFVRLWRKLGWALEELDGALQALLPRNSQPVTLTMLGGALATGLLYLAHLESLSHRLSLGRRGLVELPVLWTALPTRGVHTLYARLFLRPSVLKADKVFDDAFGNYLSNSTELIVSHLTVVQAALNLTAKDIANILIDSGQDPDTAVLSVDSLSLLYRYGLLAKALKFSVADLIALKALSALDPFTPLKPDPITRIAEDVPFTQTLRFVEIAEVVRASGFDVQDLSYLLSHQFDPVGKYRDNPKAFLSFARSLGVGLRAIQFAQAIPLDLASLTNDVLQQKVALVLSANDAATFMGLWSGTLKQTVVIGGIQPASALPAGPLTNFPEVALQYDPVTQSQDFTYLGGLTDAHAVELQTANPSPILAALIAKLLAAQRAFFDRALSPFLALADLQSILVPSANRIATLAGKLFPYVQHQLSWQLVAQSLTTSLGADARLVQALITHPAMLNDSTMPATPLAATFALVAQNSLDGSGSSPDQPPTLIHLEGYLEVPVTGPYRFFAQADKAGAQATLTIDALPDPVIAGTVAGDGGEVDGVIVLKAATLYLLQFDGSNLGGGAMNLLVQGETLPKDSISRLSLYSKAALDGAARARTLLVKSFAIVSKFALSERELRYLLVEPSATSAAGMSLSQLPADVSDVTPANAAALFQRFLNLASYVRLRAEIAGGGDELIGLFERAQRQPPSSTATTFATTAAVPPDLLDDLATRIAELSRRDKATVRGAMNQLGLTVLPSTSDGTSVLSVPPLRNADGLMKLWRLLQLTEKFGIDAQSLACWATAKPDATVAQDIRNTIKARYDPGSWLSIAPTIFDKLRRLQRDALVAFIMHRNEFESRDQLFEYFLVDPGMEPIVQTSRLRLAISCVQTFIQRCLLNLEPDVQPAALVAEQWQWMKRYRVWEAGREIFLHPENYMEMEFRDDKTDLFQELEGTLLQNDVTADVAEDALFTYLSKLENIANLEIVTLCAEQNPADPDATAIHVIARTRVTPRTYYYRRFVDQMWTAWEAVTTNFAGDHIVAVVWQDRLNVFWLTFIHQVKTGNSASSDSSGDDGDQKDEPKLADLKFSDMQRRSKPAGLPPKIIQVQLNWAEYYQGKWSTPSTSGGSDDSGDDGSAGGDSGGDGPPPGSIGNPLTVVVDAAFDASDVTVHANVDLNSDPQAACVSVTFPEALFTPTYHHPADGKRGRKSPIVRTVSQAPEYRPRTLAFKVVSKHASPTVETGMPQDPPPFPGIKAATTHFAGTRAFQVQYVESIQSIDGRAPTVTVATQDIFKGHGSMSPRFSLTVLGSPLNAEAPEIGTLVSPFFFADGLNSFFVEPALTETTIDKWEHWAIPVPRANGHGVGRGPAITAAFPKFRPPKTLPKGVKPFDGAFDPGSRYKIHIDTDGVTNTSSVLHFGGSTVGAQGATGASKPRVAAPPPARPAPKKGGHK